MVVDLRDICHLRQHPYATWAEAESVRQRLIREAVMEAIDAPMQIV
jgi:hypothetical protein